MFCNNCGNEINDNSKFCNKCGKPVRNIKQNQTSDNIPGDLPNTIYNKPVTNINKKRKEQRTYLILTGILVIAILAGITIKQLKNGNKAIDIENVQNNTYDDNTNINISNKKRKDKTENKNMKIVKKTEKNTNKKENANNKNDKSRKKSHNKTFVKNSSEYILPDSNRKYYNMKDLKGLTAKEARLARNELFARHGRKFDDKELQKYFNSCSWYKGTIAPEYFYEEEFFNKYEIANRDLIIKYEAKKGYR